MITSSSTCCAAWAPRCARCARRSIPKAAPTASTTTIPTTGTVRCTPSAMPEVGPDPLYRLLAWLSPAYPIGAFSYSHGVETAVEEGFITDRASLVAWLETVLRDGTGRVDGALFAAAWRAAEAQDWTGFAAIAERAAAWRG